MPRLILLAFLLLPFTVKSFSIDSLENVLASPSLSEKDRMTTLNELAFSYADTDPQKGIRCAYEALELSRSLKSIENEAKAMAYLGYLHRITGDYDKAIRFSFDVLELTDGIESRYAHDFAYTILGLVYERLDELDKAIHYHRLALKVERGDRNRAHNINNLSNVFYKMGELDSTIKYDKMSIAIRERINDLPGMAESYNNIGEVYRTLEKYDSAIFYYKKSLDISYELEDQNSIVLSTMNYGAAQVSQGLYDEARKKLNFAYGKAKELNFKQWEVESLTYLKDLSEKTGDYRKALAYHEEYVAQKDSIFNIEKEREIKLVESSYERLQQEKELELLRAENRLSAVQRNFLIAGVVVLFVVFGLIINRQKLKAEARQKLAKAREDELRKELEYHSKSLSNHTLSMIQKNGMLEELKSEAKLLRDSLDDEHVRKLNSINRLIDHTINVDDDWKQFEMYFENVHNDFFKKLKEKHSSLTPSDMRLCALVKLNLNIKESATILGISPDSVKIARYRLRKKLNLDNEDNLTDAIMV